MKLYPPSDALNNFVIPAPLAGWTDYAMREVLVACGAREVWTEMVNATALVRDNAKTLAMVKSVQDKDVRQVVQLFGRDANDFVTVIQSGLLKDYAEVNLNMGCPAPKIIKNHCGCDLMRHLDDAKHLIEVCRDATKRTGQALSVKMRLGWDHNIAVEFAQTCERAGVDRLIVHGRLGIDGYRGIADYAGIARVNAAVKIPVIANGDVSDRASYEKCLTETHADCVMVGPTACFSALRLLPATAAALAAWLATTPAAPTRWCMAPHVTTCFN